MKKAYLITISTFLLFLTLISFLSYYSIWNYRVEGSVAKLKNLDKMPFIFDDVQYSMREILQLHPSFQNRKGVFTVSFDDFVPAPTNITTLLQQYKSFLEGDYARNYNIILDLNQTDLLSHPRILFSNGIIYEYDDAQKNTIFLHGGGQFTSAIVLKIRADKKWNTTQANWNWNSSGGTYVIFDMKDSEGNIIPVNGSTQGWISAYDNNNVTLNFANEGTVTPKIQIQAGDVDGEIGGVKVKRIGPVDYGISLTENVTSYGPVTAYLPAFLNVSDGVVFVFGRINLERM
ncbi:MAG: hypothetical protein J7L23_05310 [Candidatus Diapherotrites archaeon]|nr:hypothetical protein [Candidatus Diapherotrites archaeon]